jgi:hypothetical protein
MTFQQEGNFGNLSRMDPTKLSISQISQPFIHTIGSSRPIVLVSAILVSDCYLVNPKTSGNAKPQRVITGGIFEGEWERLVSAIGMVTHTTDFKAQLYMDKLSFTSAPFQKDGRLIF